MGGESQRVSARKNKEARQAGWLVFFPPTTTTWFLAGEARRSGGR